MRGVRLFAVLAVVSAGVLLPQPGWAASDARTTCLRVEPYPNFLTVIAACTDALGHAGPDRLPILLQLGEAQHWAGHQSQEVADTFEAALQINPKGARALIGHAYALMGLGRAAEAQSEFETALTVEPGNGKAILGIAINYVNLEPDRPDFRQQIALYERVLPGTPYYYKARRNIALIYRERLHEPGEALKAYDGVLAAGSGKLAEVPYVYTADQRIPRNFEAQTRKERLLPLQELGRFQEALAETKLLISQYPENLDLLASRFFLFWQTGDFQSALLDMRSLDARGVPFLVAPEARFAVLYQSKNDDEVLRSAEQVRTHPASFERDDLAAALLYSGLSKRRKADAAGARSDVLEAVQMMANYRYAMLMNAKAHHYYEGDPAGPFDDKQRNAIEACLADPEC